MASMNSPLPQDPVDIALANSYTPEFAHYHSGYYGIQELPTASQDFTTHQHFPGAQHASNLSASRDGGEDAQSYNTLISQTSPEESAPDAEKRLAIKESIGKTGLFAIFGGAIGSLTSLAFLIFLWTGQGSSLEAVSASRAWRAIVLSEWTAQATTLAALLIRVAVAAQTTVCTSMLASLFLERRQVLKSNAAQFSVLRAVNDGPLMLTTLIMKSFSRLVCIETVLVFAITISSFALQFSSTILFSDLQQSLIAADSASFPVYDYIPSSIGYLYASDILQFPPVYATFGELPSNSSSSPDSKGFSATGPKTRAFVPWAEPENRTAIHSFSGNTVSLFSNVACMRPEMESNYTGIHQSIYGGSPYIYGQVAGTLYYGKSLREAHSVPSLCDSEGCLARTFNCSVPGGKDSDTGFSGSFCLIDVVYGYPEGLGHSPGLDTVAEPWSNNSFVYLMFSTNMFTSDWNVSQSIQSLEAAPRMDTGEWIRYEIQPARYIDVTLCFSTFHADLAHVDMTATGRLVEPRGNWTSTGHGDTTPVRKYLGVSDKNSTMAERGILTIDSIKAPEKLSPLVTDKKFENQSDWTLAQLAGGLFGEGMYNFLAGYWDPGYSFQACTVCDFVGNTLHSELSALIQDTVSDTGRAADALQAYTTSLANTFYHEFAKGFTGTENVQTSFTKSVQVVQSCREYGCKGLISVASLVGFHLLCVAVVTFIYVRKTHYSRQGNFWHAVSQLTGPDLSGIIERSNDMSDKALAKEIEKEGEDTFMTLKRTESGRIDMVKKSDMWK
ncbi:hypothetical protein F4802DRAFT_555109 [Xylaria palmicola]|nr:hypothetical protein F4802DRAFT_555109 [Xylaria palmicola]